MAINIQKHGKHYSGSGAPSSTDIFSGLAVQDTYADTNLGGLTYQFQGSDHQWHPITGLFGATVGTKGDIGQTGPKGDPGIGSTITKIVISGNQDVLLPSPVNFQGLLVIVNPKLATIRLVGPVNGLNPSSVQESVILISDNTQFIIIN